MIKKLLFVCLLMTALFLYSCNKNTTQASSETSIEIISMITVLTMGVAILIAYTFKRR